MGLKDRIKGGLMMFGTMQIMVFPVSIILGLIGGGLEPFLLVEGMASPIYFAFGFLIYTEP